MTRKFPKVRGGGVYGDDISIVLLSLCYIAGFSSLFFIILVLFLFLLFPSSTSLCFMFSAILLLYT